MRSPIALQGLDAGADDYLSAFDLDEWRRASARCCRRKTAARRAIEHLGVVLDPAAHRVIDATARDRAVAAEFALLQLLLERPG